MSGKTDLSILLQEMQPQLQDGSFVFCVVSPQVLQTLSLYPVGQFHEQEGITVILRREEADKANLSYESTFSMITLMVHSSLFAVGFLAAIANCLAQAGISVNAISAYYHDHLFIPAEQTELALKLLQNLAKNPQLSL